MAVAFSKDWLSTRKLFPSWILSGLFHAVMVSIVLWTMPLWDRGPVGFHDEPSQEIGIYIKNAGDKIEPVESVNIAEPEAQPAARQTPALSDPLGPRKAVPENFPIAMPLPEREAPPTIGPGSSTIAPGPSEPKEVIQPNGSGPGRPPVSGGKPGASFMGAKDTGTRVVFVIDASESMSSNRAMQQAKAALIASVNALEPTQLFQIIFYNDDILTMTLKSSAKDRLYYATDSNKQGARNFIQMIDPDAGTSHGKALQQALLLKPDMIFLLTDSGEPKLSAGDLDELQKKNKGRTRIHSIEFGIGPELNTKQNANFLRTLARQNGGTYRYVNVLEGNLRMRGRE